MSQPTVTPTLAEQIRTLRAAVGLTQSELGAQLGVGQTAVSEWERGRSKPSYGLMRPMADALGAHYAHLMWLWDRETAA